jgi:hypothetical protein
VLLEEGQVRLDRDYMGQRRLQHRGAEALDFGGIPAAGGVEAEAERGPQLAAGGGQTDGEGLSAHQTSRAVLGWIAPWSARGA